MNTVPPANPQPRRRTPTGILLRLLLLLLLLAVMLVAWLPLLLPRILEQQGIHLHWQQPQWSWHGLHVQRLDLSYQQHRVRAHDLQLGWLWQKYPLQSVTIGQLHITSALSPGEDSPTGNGHTGLSAFTPWLPRQVDIRQLNADIADMALVTGSLYIKSAGQRPLWQPDQLELDLTLGRLHPGWLASIPPALQPDTLRVRTLTHADAENTPDNAIQVVSLDVHSLGQTQIQLSGILTLLHDTRWHGRLEQARLHFDMPRLQLGELQMEQAQGQLYFSAVADEHSVRLQLEQPASLSAAQVRPDTDTLLQQVTATLTGLELGASQPDNPILELHADYHVSTAQLQHPLLYPHTWSASGTARGSLSEIQASASINNTGGLSLTSNWTWQNGILSGKITLPNVFLRAGNPLRDTLPDWPEPVDFNNGRLSASANLTLLPGQPVQILGLASGNGLAGLVDRSELSGLDFTVYFRLDDGERLRLDIPRLQVTELNPGIPLEQLMLQDASFSGHLDHLQQGSASWKSVQGQLLGGSFSLPASEIRLAGENRLQLQLSGIELNEILTRYPTEGLYGQGTIDGTLPLLVGPQGVFVDQGSLQARRPGNLKFQSDSIRSLGMANPAMRQVTGALEDFHFDLLSSTLSYEPSGKLLFNIRLEGKNPAVEQGRPIHLNLNLEEDLPALLASIQLGNHVSETLQERIRQRLQNR